MVLYTFYLFLGLCIESVSRRKKTPEIVDLRGFAGCEGFRRLHKLFTKVETK
jgi:hypothetical protein